MSHPSHQPVVLIIDDDVSSRTILEARVREAGYTALTAGNGRAGLDLMRDQSCDAILLDLDMPEMDGFAVMATLNADPVLCQIPVIVISGFSDSENVVKSIEMGAVDFLPKPFNKALLKARLKTSLAKAHGSQDFFVAAPPAPVIPPQGVDQGMLDTQHFRSTETFKIGRTRITRLIGSGAFADVYLGHDDWLDLPMAVKLLKDARVGNSTLREQFLSEARIAARLLHPKIVRLYDVGEYNASVYVTYEYMDGGTLQQLLAGSPDRRLEPERAVAITLDIAEALQEANRHGIIHCDVKPANILLDHTGVAKLADLGLARKMLPSDAGASDTQMISGTPSYMAPEQITKDYPVDIRADLYGLGVVLFEMVTGRLPFTAKNSMEMLDHHRRTPAPDPCRIVPSLPRWLGDICLKLLAKSPKERYAGPEDLLVILKSVWSHGRLPTPAEMLVSNCAGDPDMYELLQMYGGELGKQCLQLSEQLQAGSVDMLRRLGHNLKGSGGGFGFPAISEVGGRLEDAATRANAVNDEIRSSVKELIRVCRQAQAGIATLKVPSPPPTAPPPSGERAEVKRRIAVVEDNPDNRLLVRAILEDHYDIDEYEAGPEALEGLPKNLPDLLLLDISLPGMDGTAVLQAIRADPVLYHLPVIAFTAHAMAGDTARFLAAGFDGYVSKPIVDEELLLSAIEHALAGKQHSLAGA